MFFFAPEILYAIGSGSIYSMRRKLGEGEIRRAMGLGNSLSNWGWKLVCIEGVKSLPHERDTLAKHFFGTGYSFLNRVPTKKSSRILKPNLITESEKGM